MFREGMPALQSRVSTAHALCSLAVLPNRCQMMPVSLRFGSASCAGPSTRPPRGGLSAARRAPAAEDAENAAPPNNDGGDLAIFVDPEFGVSSPVYSRPQMRLLLSKVDRLRY